MSDYERDTVLERDEVYRDNLAATIRRQQQGKITASEVIHIRERLVENAMRRHRVKARAQRFSNAVMA